MVAQSESCLVQRLVELLVESTGMHWVAMMMVEKMETIWLLVVRSDFLLVLRSVDLKEW